MLRSSCRPYYAITIPRPCATEREGVQAASGAIAIKLLAPDPALCQLLRGSVTICIGHRRV